MNMTLLSDSPDGGRLSSGPTSPGRESPFPIPRTTILSRPLSDLETALRKGRLAKRFSERISGVCARLPEDTSAFNVHQLTVVLGLASQCGSRKEVSDLLGFKPNELKSSLMYSRDGVVHVLLPKATVVPVQEKRVCRARITLTEKDRREHVRAWTRAYRKNKRATDVSFRIVCCLRARLACALKGRQKSSSTLSLLGCSVEYFKAYLESLWKPGMSWENYGVDGWHIDHVRPCASFDLSKRDDQGMCFHYTNLQPLWGRREFCESRILRTKRLKTASPENVSVRCYRRRGGYET